MKTLIIIGIILGIGIILLVSLNTLSDIRKQECEADDGIMTGPFNCMISRADYGSPPLSSESENYQLDEPFEIKMDQRIQFEDLELYFYDIEDSRCPLDVTCEPFTKIEIMFGEKWNDKLVPVTFTEVTTHAETLDEITVWNFGLIGYSGGDRGIVWDTLPDEINRIWYEITDDNGKKIIDNIRMPGSWAVPADQHIYTMDCGLFQTVEGESAHPTSILIKNNTSIIHARNSWMGIYPDSNYLKTLELSSLMKQKNVMQCGK
jgi:hypothetical protein